MLDGQLIWTLAIAYLGLLFLVAWVGDYWLRSRQRSGGRPMIYALSIAVYCSSWTYFGSVGWASTTGYDFLAVYIGPILMFTIGAPIILRTVRLAKSQNITSVADFLAARYGKSPVVAGLVTCVLVAGTLPYIALQMKAIVVSIETLGYGGPTSIATSIESPPIVSALPIEIGLAITLVLALFTVLFGTRHIDATEHQDGLMLAIAGESLIKLMAFLAVGFFVVFYAFGGPLAFIEAFQTNPETQHLRNVSISGSTALTVGLLSFICILLLPRQFHVTVVENHSEQEIRRATWLLPLYLVLINLFVVPIAAAGLILIPQHDAVSDMFVLSVPMSQGANAITTIAFVGGLSAATAMVVVETVALSIMVCNGFVVPLLLRQTSTGPFSQYNFPRFLLYVRRASIVAILLMCYAVYRTVGGVGNLAGIGLIAFAAIAQLAPAFFGGLIWRRATASGAIAGILVGAIVWAYTLVIPWIVQAGWMPYTLLTDGPFGLAFLKPQALFFVEFEQLTHGVFWSLGANITAYVAVSLVRRQEPIERLQAHVFIINETVEPVPQHSFRLWRSSITLGDLRTTAARYLGEQRAERSFGDFLTDNGLPDDPSTEADIQTLRFTERLLSRAIGAASARLVLSLLLRRGDVGSQSALRLLDDASEALQYNRDLLQSALDQVRHGISVCDGNNKLICWNRQFRQLLELPPELGRVGVPLDRILRVCAERGDFGQGNVDNLVANRLTQMALKQQTFQERLNGGEKIIEFRTTSMPQGGIVTTYLDISDRVRSANALERANQTLEQRVRERTAELVKVNEALEQAKRKADELNLDKTRFIAAASHDILQPMNAARLYTSSLLERSLPPDESRIAQSIDASLVAVEEIFQTLVDLSRMDAGRLEAEMQPVNLATMLERLRVEFDPIARNKRLEFTIVNSSSWVHSDPKLLHRLLQNLVSNAIKYTDLGKILLGVRHRAGLIEIQVIDTGPGIPAARHAEVFKEFHRLDSTAGSGRGIGLGLSIVDRISRLLDHHVGLRSTQGKGSCFFVRLHEIEAQQETPKPEVLPAFALNGVHVLCIDNEPEVLDGMATLLGGWHCVVTKATSVEEALAGVRMQSRPVDIVLADYHLDNNVTGDNAIEELRAVLGAGLPAAIITADNSPEVHRKLRDSAIPVLRKPVKAGALRATISRLSRQPIAAE
ncbi:MAG: PAS domain-containing hybrid sensor histidine kinase/response regulator [Pseudomonadota bacterium]